MRRSRQFLAASWIVAAFAAAACGDDDATPGQDVATADAAPYPYAPSPASPDFVADWRSGTLDCAMDASAMLASDAASVTVGSTTFLAGWSQVSGDNQDPFLARLDAGAVTWCVAAEAQPPDGRAYGLAWDGADTLYVVYTVVGGGTAFDGHGGWVEAYGTMGSGGNVKIAVIARHDPTDGALRATTFVPAQLASRRSVNTLSPRAFTVLADRTVELLGDSAFSPLNPDRSRMCEGGTEYPNGFRAVFSADLTTMLCAQTEECSLVTTPCD